MIATPVTIDVPLWRDERGKIRIGKTRVLLELVIYAFNEGETPEGIIDRYSALSLPDVYAVLAYYLQHRKEVDAYVKATDEKARKAIQEIEASYTPETQMFIERLRAIRDAKSTVP